MEIVGAILCLLLELFALFMLVGIVLDLFIPDNKFSIFCNKVFATFACAFFVLLIVLLIVSAFAFVIIAIIYTLKLLF